ncbi:MAG TPA: flavodoxin domain-containing protein [Gaiellaceae bacterium]
MTDVLVAFASRHGATEELARAIGQQLSHSGLSVDVRPMNEVDSLQRYSAYVLGSAVYMGAWMPAAREFLERHRRLLATKPTWLFSSGPIGEAPADETKAFDATEVVTAVHARDHHLFGGKLDRHSLSLRERLLTRLVRAQDGDHRDWAIAAAWATAISHSLASRHAA